MIPNIKSAAVPITVLGSAAATTQFANPTVTIVTLVFGLVIEILRRLSERKPPKPGA